MLDAEFPFTSGDREYKFWAWKGDYINLGMGAELGLYSNKSVLMGIINYTTPFEDDWLVDTSLALTMSMELEDKAGNPIAQYSSQEKQWWITSFNPEIKDLKASYLTATYKVSFENKTTLFNDFAKAYDGIDKRWVFDYDNKTATLTFN
ncbi:DUF4474 domain-containing protein [Sedimentibacter sp. zth1]|uniref:DUF4474 domain-containing protein n=1 Tax=Sedimentibacter sp. zth1 TaxID=2816908 RepID=UPI001A933E91|nr:DUF4474 domain-containing protein [Sedimentibacter sp. zth1]